MKIATAIAFALLSTACTEWDITITTGGTDNSTAVSTVITASAGDSETEGVTSEQLMTSTTDPSVSASETTLVDETTGEVTVTTGDDTTGTSDATSGTTEEPTTGPEMFFPAPIKCATIVEVLGRADSETRHVTVDSSACPRGAELSLTMHAGFDGPWTTTLGVAGSCTVFGGTTSAAMTDPAGEFVTIEGVDIPLFYVMILSVDGMVSDTVKMPELMTGSWSGEPDAPTSPIRRADDWSWVSLTGHQQGCDLAASED